jgi:hypothetical protein
MCTSVGKHMLLLQVRHRGSPHMPASGGAAAACMRACETERAWGGPAYAWAHVASEAGWVWDKGVRCVRRGHRSTI